ncbi:MAG: HNH endonuclease [candidate division Zixibacteria bacterium]|nr:HNH endonuclease [candidate division Zixibacteria bacterium]
MSARDRIREFFEKNVGKIVTTQQVRKVGKISEYARRIRELRELEGMQIKSHMDDPGLKPGQYILETLGRIPAFGSAVQAQKRNEILERNGYSCQLCGAAGGDPDPLYPGRRVRLHIDHVIPQSQGGTDNDDNLRVLCSACNQAKSNIQTASESAINLLARVRRAPRSVQIEVYQTLKKKFES